MAFVIFIVFLHYINNSALANAVQLSTGSLVVECTQYNVLLSDKNRMHC